MKQLSQKDKTRKLPRQEKDKLNTAFNSCYARAQKLSKIHKIQNSIENGLLVANCLDWLKSTRPFIDNAKSLKECLKISFVLSQISNKLDIIEKSLEWGQIPPLARTRPMA
ncbi:MAG: hypothetical protein V1822_00485 [Candidatus Micrarchaeota archaeon]